MPEHTLELKGSLALADGPAGLRLIPGFIRVTGGVLERVEPDPAVGGDDARTIIFPGFIDAHAHLPQFRSVGVAGLELLDWLDAVIFPAESRWADADLAHREAADAARQLLSFGTTAVAAYATVHHSATQRAIDALADAGMAGHVGQVLMDTGAPPRLARPAGDQADALELKPRDRVMPSIAPRFALSCSEELLALAAEMASRTGWLAQTHLAETTAECRAVESRFGVPYTEVYRRAGLLTPRAVLAHGIHLSRADREALARVGAVIAHCPTANEFLRAGRMDRAGTLAAGARLALGSDVAGGPDRSMVRVARAMAMVASRDGGVFVPAAECFRQITAGNADALDLASTGRLAPGLDADLVIVEPDIPWQDHPDPLSLLLYAWDDRWIRRVYAAGRPVFPAR
ncbi:MAG: amidohydrolase family protein [Phycisphaeraceae bacterium]|nr:MAG: amidohydrolase family protein [Phycisphaeraceae bacterium]